MNSWLFKYRFFSLNLLGTPSKFTNVPVFLIADLHNIPYIISRYIPCGLVGACCVPRYHDTSNICVATLSVYVRARYKQLCTVKIEIDVATLSAQLYARCVPCYMKVVWQHCQYTYTHSAVLQRETRKCCGNTVSTHIRTLPCYIVKQESVVATLSVHIYALCRATSWNKKVLWQHCQYIYTNSAVLHRETRKCCGNTDNVNMPEVSFCLLTPPQLAPLSGNAGSPTSEKLPE
jgi:hypothetical protein